MIKKKKYYPKLGDLIKYERNGSFYIGLVVKITPHIHNSGYYWTDILFNKQVFPFVVPERLITKL